MTLATQDDLTARGITLEASLADTLLASASESVRDAAGSPISRATSTVTLTGGSSNWLRLPLFAVREVTDVSIDGRTVEFRLVDGRLWRHAGWGGCEPTLVTMTVDHGLDVVPADIVDLVCSLVAAGAAAQAEGYDPKRNLAYERIDDYQAGFRQGDDEVVSPMVLPTRTREWLRSRFGTGVAVTGSYS